MLQFLQAAVSGVGLGLLDELGLLLVLEDPGDAEQGCSKSPEAMFSQLDGAQMMSVSLGESHKHAHRKSKPEYRSTQESSPEDCCGRGRGPRTSFLVLISTKSTQFQH